MMKDESELWAEVKRQQRQRRRRVAKIICGSAVLILLAIVVAIGIRHIYLGRQIQAELTKIRQEGYPTNFEEFNEWYKTPPAGLNAADVLVKAFAESVRRSWQETAALPIVGVAALPARNAPLSPEMKKAIADYLAKNAAALELLHEGAGMKACRYPGRLTFFGVDWSHVNKAHTGGDLLGLEAVLRAEDNDGKGAVQAVMHDLALGMTLVREPATYSSVQGYSITHRSLLRLERLLSRSVLTDEQLADLSAAIASARDEQAVARALAGNRALFSSVFKNPAALANMGTQYDPQTGNVSNPFTGWPGTWLMVSGSLKADHLFYLKAMRRSLEIAQTPLPKRVPLARRFAHELEQPDWAEGHRLSRSPQTFQDTGIILLSDIRWVEFSHCAQVALAIERYRLETGRCPDTLSVLVPEYMAAVPMDPCDGQPLRYKQRENGYVVYSVGGNLRDDGGAEPNYGLGTDDLSFTVER
jgi:hypothetical protein